MIDLAKLFVLKFLDTAIGALKNIFMIKNMSFFSAVANTISYLFYILLMKRLMSDTSTAAILTTLVSVFIGQYFTQVVMNKADKDRIWEITITPTSVEDGQAIANKLLKHNIPITTDQKEKNGVEVIEVVAFSKSKVISALVESVVKKYEIKLAIVEIRNRF